MTDECTAIIGTSAKDHDTYTEKEAQHSMKSPLCRISAVVQIV